MAADVGFEVELRVKAPPRDVWDLLIDWKAHESFIPATRVEFETDEVDAVGTVFTAFTGYGPLTLEDRMRVTQLEWDDKANEGHCEVDKLGPLLSGTASFTVSEAAQGATVTWAENLTVDKIPAGFGPVVGFGAGLGFRLVGVLLDRELR